MCRVSVCIAAYNGGAYIEKQLNSIVDQLSNDDEIIISDDGSKDNTIEIIENFDDSRIKLLHNHSSKNLIHNFENALKNAKGDYIFLSDQDDIWSRNKVDIMLAYLQKYDLVISDCSIIDSNDEMIYESFFDLRNSGKGLLKNFIKNTYIGCCMAFNRHVLNKSLPLPCKIPMHDWWIGLVNELFGSIFFCSEKLVKYRRHSHNISASVGQSEYSFMEKLSFRKDLITLLYKVWRNDKSPTTPIGSSR